MDHAAASARAKFRGRNFRHLLDIRFGQRWSDHPSAIDVEHARRDRNRFTLIQTKRGKAANGIGEWGRVAKVEAYASGNQLQLAVPRAALGMKPGSMTFDFKWVDHLSRPDDVMDFYLSGDVAPDARFCYRFTGQ